MYGVPIAVQTKVMLLALGLGFLVGIIYDIFRIIRLSISHGKRAVFVQDILFFFLFAGITFAFCLSQTDGQVRFYIIFAEILGFLIYYFSFGAFVIRLSGKIIVMIKKLYALLLRLISYPLVLLLKLIRFIFKPFYKKIQKIIKNFTKMANFHLQVSKLMLYNMFGKSFSFKKNKKGRNTSNGKKVKEKT